MKLELIQLRNMVVHSYENFIFTKSYELSQKVHKEVRTMDMSVIYPLTSNKRLSSILYFLAPCIFYLSLVKDFVSSFFRTVIRYKNKTSSRSVKNLLININKTLSSFTVSNLPSDTLVLEYPQSISTNLYKKIKIQDLVNPIDCFKVLKYSFKIAYQLAEIYGNKSYIYSTTIYSMITLKIGVSKLEEDTNIYITAQKDRWATVLDFTDHSMLNIIQHGTNYVKGLPSDYLTSYLKYDSDANTSYINMPHKLKNYKKIITFSEKEGKYMKLGEHDNPGLIISPQNYKLNLTEDIKSCDSTCKILIIGNSLSYIEQEISIIKYLSTTQGFLIFLKPHPKFDDTAYKKIGFPHSVIVIDKNQTKYPKVDVVISYESTLAHEYENNGTYVIYYQDIVDENHNINFHALMELLKTPQ